MGRPLAEAERLLAGAGMAVVEVTRTGPPGGRSGGTLRVVRVRQSAQGVHLLVAAAMPLPEGKVPHEQPDR